MYARAGALCLLLREPTLRGTLVLYGVEKTWHAVVRASPAEGENPLRRRHLRKITLWIAYSVLVTPPATGERDPRDPPPTHFYIYVLLLYYVRPERIDKYPTTIFLWCASRRLQLFVFPRDNFGFQYFIQSFIYESSLLVLDG